MTNFLSKYGRVIRISLILMIFGVVAKLAETYLVTYVGESKPWLSLAEELLNHATVALFSVALLGFILETRHFYEYFHHLIVETIIDKRFIAGLQDTEVKELQKRCLEAFFHIEQLDKEEGFYKFYLDKIEKHIGGPFREDTVAITTVEYSDDGKSFCATDEVSYTCRKLGKTIQESAEWTAESDEIMETGDFEIAIKTGDSDWQTYYARKGELADPVLEAKLGGHGFILPLKDYQDCDGLKVKVKALYRVALERPFSWTMPCLSNRFSGSIKYPSNLDIYFDSFGLDKSALPKKRPEAVDGFRTYHF